MMTWSKLFSIFLFYNVQGERLCTQPGHAQLSGGTNLTCLHASHSNTAPWHTAYNTHTSPRKEKHIDTTLKTDRIEGGRTLKRDEKGAG